MSSATNFSLASVHSVIVGLKPFRANMLAFVCGVITLFCFAPFHIWPIYIVSITLLMWLIDGARIHTRWRQRCFAVGFWFGAGFTLSTMHWLAAPFLVNPEKHLLFIWMPLVLFPAGLGLFFAGASLLTGYLWSNGPFRILALVAAFSVFEYLRGVVFGGFPWNWPGTIWKLGLPMSQLASIGGVYGLSVVTLLIAGAPAALADFRKSSSALDRFLPIAVAVIIFALSWGWGSQRLINFDADEYLAVRLVDVGVPQNEKYPETREEKIEANRNVLIAYLEAMGDDFPDEPRLIVWPESALPFPLLQNPDALDAISERLGFRTLITGTTRINRYAESGAEYYNSLAVLTRNSNRRGALAIYDKFRLVPFGEMAAADFIPFGNQVAGVLPAAMQSQATSGFTPGLIPSVIELPSGEKFLPLICYEGIFSSLSKKNSKDANFLLNISIDSWFGSKIGPVQHFTNVSYRSIETGKPMVRATNLGISRGLDALGQSIEGVAQKKQYNGWTVEVRDILLPMETRKTFFALSIPAFVEFLVAMLCVISVFMKKEVVTSQKSDKLRKLEPPK